MEKLGSKFQSCLQHMCPVYFWSNKRKNIIVLENLCQIIAYHETQHPSFRWGTVRHRRRYKHPREIRRMAGKIPDSDFMILISGLPFLKKVEETQFNNLNRPDVKHIFVHFFFKVGVASVIKSISLRENPAAHGKREFISTLKRKGRVGRRNLFFLLYRNPSLQL